MCGEEPGICSLSTLSNHAFLLLLHEMNCNLVLPGEMLTQVEAQDALFGHI